MAGGVLRGRAVAGALVVLDLLDVGRLLTDRGLIALVVHRGSSGHRVAGPLGVHEGLAAVVVARAEELDP